MHETQVHTVPVALINILHHSLPVPHHPRHQKMPDNDALLHFPRRIKFRQRLLPMHLPEGFLGPFRIIRSAGIFQRPFPIHKLKVIQVNVGEAVQKPDLRLRLIAAAVHDIGNLQSPVPGILHGRHNRRKIVVRCHQVNVVGTLLLQSQKNVAEPFDADPFPLLRMRELIILTEHTLQCAAGKENGTAALGAGNAGLLPEVKSSPSYINLI